MQSCMAKTHAALGLKDAEMPDHAVCTGEGGFQREAVCARGSRAGGVGLTNHFGV